MGTDLLLAPVTLASRSEAVVGTAVRMAGEPRYLLLGIAPAGRPADVPAAAGRTRMGNFWADVADVSAVLARPRIPADRPRRYRPAHEAGDAVEVRQP